MAKRVVITGIGAVTPLGCNAEEIWKKLLDGRSGISKIERFDTKGFEVTFGGEIKDAVFDPTKHMDPRDARRMNRFAQFAVAAAVIALDDSGLKLDQCNRARVGCILGSGIGGMSDLEESHANLLNKGPTRISPFFVPKLMANAGAAQVAIRLKISGPNFTTVSACASSNHAIGMAMKLIQGGVADAVLSGGSEAALTPLGLAGFSCMTALSKRNDAPQKASRPFDRDRDGFVLSEGGAVFVVEALDHAAKRGAAKIYAELLGFGQSDDAFHLTAPDEDGAGGALAMKYALEDGGVKPEQVSYINAHGTSTKLNDKIETVAIKKVFGDHARRLVINSTKSMLGHSLGAASAIELVPTIFSIRDNKVHPTINLENKDPDCDLDYVPGKAREVKVDYALSNSLGFGGHNTSVLVGRYRG